MPELPEVETTRLGIVHHILGGCVEAVLVRKFSLRWPIPVDLEAILHGQTLLKLERRAKYLLFYFENGCLLIHLGMSGSLRILPQLAPAAKHDHVDILFDKHRVLRYTDPRRFGAVLWLGQCPDTHALLKNLGPEPLSDAFNGEHLFVLSRKRKLAVKQFIMDQHIVTGTGNNEALFSSGIRPDRAAGDISLPRYEALANHIKTILAAAIAQGGTTLRDFTNSEGKPGYFKQQLSVYGRTGLPCRHCQQTLTEIRLSGRSSVFCSNCQT
jgi:formamidopyrimidine-DNA glycosylase